MHTRRIRELAAAGGVGGNSRTGCYFDQPRYDERIGRRRHRLLGAVLMAGLAVAWILLGNH